MRQPLSPSERKKLAEELSQRYRAWGDSALRDGNRVLFEHYYQLAEHCLHLTYKPNLEVIHGPATLPPSKEGGCAPKKPNLRVIQGSKPFPSITQPVIKRSRVKPSRSMAKVIAIINFEKPSAEQASNRLSQEEQNAFHRRLIAVARARHKLSDISKLSHLRFEQEVSLHDEEVTQRMDNEAKTMKKWSPGTDLFYKKKRAEQDQYYYTNLALYAKRKGYYNLYNRYSQEATYYLDLANKFGRELSADSPKPALAVEKIVNPAIPPAGAANQQLPLGPTEHRTP